MCSTGAALFAYFVGAGVGALTTAALIAFFIVPTRMGRKL